MSPADERRAQAEAALATFLNAVDDQDGDAIERGMTSPVWSAGDPRARAATVAAS